MQCIRAGLALLLAAGVAGAAPCRICGHAASLLQVDRPKDCTCITGMKTYPTTPRDELKAMGKVALRNHLEKCVRDRGALEAQAEYQLAADKAQVKKIQATVARKEDALGSTKNATAKTKAAESAEKKDLMKETDAQETEFSNLKNEYNAQYTAWFKMNQESTEKLARLASCEKPAAACRPKPSGAVLLAIGRHAERLTPEQEQMYDRIEKVEACESASIKLADKLAKSQLEASRATSSGSDRMERIEQETSDHKYVTGILSKKKQIEALKARKKALAEAIEGERSDVEKYKERNAKVKETLAQLDKEIGECGC